MVSGCCLSLYINSRETVKCASIMYYLLCFWTSLEITWFFYVTVFISGHIYVFHIAYLSKFQSTSKLHIILYLYISQEVWMLHCCSHLWRRFFSLLAAKSDSPPVASLFSVINDYVLLLYAAVWRLFNILLSFLQFRSLWTYILIASPNNMQKRKLH